MQLPNAVLQDLAERLKEFRHPAFGKVKMEIELNYRESDMVNYHVLAYPVGTFKA